MLRIAAVKDRIRVGQLLTVAELDPDLLLHPQQRREPVGGLDEGRRDVEAAHGAVEALCDVTGRAAEPAADVDDMLACPQWQPVRQFHGGGKPRAWKWSTGARSSIVRRSSGFDICCSTDTMRP